MNPQEMEKHDFVLTPARYVGAPEQEDDGKPFAEKMTDLTNTLKACLIKAQSWKKKSGRT